MAQIVPM